MILKNKINDLFSICPTVKTLLCDADYPKTARHFLLRYLDEFAYLINKNIREIQPLEWELQMTCIETLKRIFSVRSERLSKFSSIRLLWLLAHEKYDELPDNFNEGFLNEMYYLFLGMQGKSGIYDQEPYPEFAKLHGREAAKVRSDQLDEMALKSHEYMKRYPTGLDSQVKQKRLQNQERIRKAFNATVEEWNDYLWQIRHVVRNSKTLVNLIDLSPEEVQAIDRARSNKLPFGITPYYVSLMDKEPDRQNDHAIRAQVIPPLNYVEKMLSTRNDPTYCFDFMLENDTSPIDLITRRYPMITILKPYNTCSQICVYCQRNWEIDDVLQPQALATQDKIDKAVQWLKDHPAVTEVLITGGDPLVMQDKMIDSILEKVAKIDHVERIRIGSRVPVVLPQRITDNLMEIIAKYHEPGRREVVLVTHFSHPYEVTPESMQAVQKFKTKGISVYNQAVFTTENSRRFELVALRRILRLIGVDPYYTFNTKGKEETKSYRVPLARLQQEIKEEARLIPGIMRTDEAVYNVPKLGKNYIRAQQHHSLITILANGRRVYEFHPWEKNLSLASTYIDTDVSITEYLLELEQRGENTQNYSTIWYYF